MTPFRNGLLLLLITLPGTQATASGVRDNHADVQMSEKVEIGKEMLPINDTNNVALEDGKSVMKNSEFWTSKLFIFLFVVPAMFWFALLIWLIKDSICSNTDCNCCCPGLEIPENTEQFEDTDDAENTDDAEDSDDAEDTEHLVEIKDDEDLEEIKDAEDSKNLKSIKILY